MLQLTKVSIHICIYNIYNTLLCESKIEFFTNLEFDDTNVCISTFRWI